MSLAGKHSPLSWSPASVNVPFKPGEMCVDTSGLSWAQELRQPKVLELRKRMQAHNTEYIYFSENWEMI